MSLITLVRHGQANSEARDETGYDRLSPLGHQQASWLGDHMATTKDHFDRVYCGTLKRHVETAEGMAAAYDVELVQDARLNELAYFDLSQRMREQHGLEVPTSREGFVRQLPMVFRAWQQGEIRDADESFDTFETRVAEAIAEISGGRGRALVVTSGGLIGMVVRQTMGLDTEGWARVCLAIMNTSVHRLQAIGDTLALTQFNGIPHLEHPNRAHAQTHL